MKQSIIELKGQVYDLNVIRSSALCLRTECILSTRCATNEETYVIECSSGYTAKVAFNGHIHLLKNNQPYEPVLVDCEGKAKAISLVECLRQMTTTSLLANQQTQTTYGIACNSLRTTVLSKAIIDLAKGKSNLIVVQTTELSVMDQLLIEALGKTHHVRYTNGNNTAIMISKGCNSDSVIKSPSTQCQLLKMHS